MLKNMKASPIMVVKRPDIEQLFSAAAKNPRQRAMILLHPNDEASLHRMYNAFQKTSYVQPHRHPLKTESFTLLQGCMKLIEFDDDGTVMTQSTLEQVGETVRIQENIWHTLVPLSEIALIFEVKEGPYDPKTDKIFHAAFPAEGDPEAKGQLLAWQG